MAKLRIPDRYQAGVSKIRRLDERTVREIRAALDRPLNLPKSESSVEPPSNPDEVAMTAMRSVSSTNFTDFKDIADALAALYGVKSTRENSVEEFVNDVSDAMESLPSDDLRLPEAEREEFKGKLSILLGAEVFSVVAKAHDLATDDERTFCQARILTDLRPVFGPRVEDGPRGMVAVHILKLAYHQGGDKHQQFYVALDSDDLQDLKKVIERAEAKAATLNSVIKNVRIFGVPKE